MPELAAHDIGPADSPWEAGLAFTCDFPKADGFVGREALLAQRAAGVPKRRLVQFLLEDPEPLVHHNEPIYRDGELVGWAETTIVVRFWLIAAMFVALGLGIFYVAWFPK